MLARVAVSTVLAAGLLGSAGCGPGKLEMNRTYALSPGDSQSIDLDPQSKPQKITVTFDGADAEVDVYIFDGKDATNPDKLPKEKALGSQKKAKSGSVTATVPGNAAAKIVVENVGGKKGDVKVNVSNQK